MTLADELATTASHSWAQCDRCQAPMDERQRYCVSCGARRPDADDPVANYLVTTARQARAATTAPAAGAPTPRGGGSGAGFRTAIILALIPVAAALGVVAGRDSTSADAALLQALKSQKAPVVNVGTGGTGGSAAAADTTETADSGKAGTSKAAKKDDNPNDAKGTVIAKTEYGSARSLTDSKVNEAQKQESKEAIEHIVESQGKEYVEQQRNLPDQIVVP